MQKKEYLLNLRLMQLRDVIVVKREEALYQILWEEIWHGEDDNYY